MAHVITFRSTGFDPRAEPANPINPIAGHALLVWLVDSLRTVGYEGGAPDAEDWGWYCDVTGPGAAYMLGASGEAEADGTTPIEWTVQIHRHRSLKDKLFGRNRHLPNDPLTALVERLLRADSGFAGVEVCRTD